MDYSCFVCPGSSTDAKQSCCIHVCIWIYDSSLTGFTGGPQRRTEYTRLRLLRLRSHVYCHGIRFSCVARRLYGVERGLLKVCRDLETTHCISHKIWFIAVTDSKKGVSRSSELLECTSSDTEEFMMDVQSAKRFMQYVCEGLHRL